MLRLILDVLELNSIAKTLALILKKSYFIWKVGDLCLMIFQNVYSQSALFVDHEMASDRIVTTFNRFFIENLAKITFRTLLSQPMRIFIVKHNSNSIGHNTTLTQFSIV